MNAYYEQIYGLWNAAQQAPHKQLYGMRNAAQQATEITARGLANCMPVHDSRKRELEERNLRNLAAWRKKYTEQGLHADFKNHNQFAKGRKSYACCVGSVK